MHSLCTHVSAPCISPTEPLLQSLIALFKTLLPRLERWLSGYEHWLCFQRTQIQSPAPTRQLKTVCNSSSRIPDTLMKTNINAHKLKKQNKQTKNPKSTPPLIISRQSSDQSKDNLAMYLYAWDVLKFWANKCLVPQTHSVKYKILGSNKRNQLLKTIIYCVHGREASLTPF